ncbi:DUF3797 domain-containing protein [Microbacteriaceae bacterium 4G12]
MDITIQTLPLPEKTLYYVQCPVCKKDRILNSIANVSSVVSEEAFRKLCGCTCKVKVEKAVPKRSGKAITAMIKGKEMTVKEIAEMYDLNPNTVRQRIRAGKSEDEIIAPSKRTSK